MHRIPTLTQFSRKIKTQSFFSRLFRNMSTVTAVPAPSPSFVKIDDNFSIDGMMNSHELQYLRSVAKGALYVCTDVDTDLGTTTNGFPAILEAFPDSSAHVSMGPGFQPDSTISAIQAFAAYESVLDNLPRPVAITCKSNRRASAIFCAYKAVKEGLNGSEIVAYARQHDFRLLSSEALTSWVITVADTFFRKPPLLFRQLFESESSTYTYLLADKDTGDAILIDPVLETVARDAQLVRDLGLNLRYVLNTHVHADHITGSGKLKEQFPECLSVISAASGAVADIRLHDGELVAFGSRHVLGLSTPGHTAGCFSFVLDDFSAVFTGDVLLIRGCGRTDFQGGSSGDLYRAVHSKLFTLPDGCAVYPAHDYKGMLQSSIREEKRLNPRLTKSAEEFDAIMAALDLPYPKKIDASLPANMNCGVF